MFTLRVLRILCCVSGSNFNDVITTIATLRERRIDTRFFAQACLNRQSQIADLRAGIVVIKFAAHQPALRLKQPRDGVANCCTTSVADVKWPGRVGGHEFHHHLLIATFTALAEIICVGEHGRDDARFRSWRQPDVDKSRTGYFRCAGQ